MNELLAQEIVQGGGIGFNAAAKLLPKGRLGRSCHPSTISRYHLEGAKLPGGRVVKLEALRLASRWVTSEGAVRRFLEALTAASNDTPAARSTRERTAADADAARQLATLGI